jgi:hypothetical protein
MTETMIPEETPQIDRSGLFKEDFVKDWIFILSMLAVAAVSFSTAHDYGNYRYFGSGDWTAVAIDVLLAALINLFVFGIGPAIFRRSRRRKKSGDLKEETLPMSKYIGIAFAVALAASAIGVFTPSDNFPGIPPGETRSECQPVGDDEVCTEVTYEGKEKLSIFRTQKYSIEKVILGQYVSQTTWEAKIDCSDETGMVVNLNAFDSEGKSVELGEAMTQMFDGLNESAVPLLISTLCNP